MLKFVDQIDRETYDTFASQHPLSSINQSAKWADIKHQWIPFHTGLYEDEKLVAVALVLIRPLPMGFRFAYVPRGPLMDFDNQEHVTAMLKGLKALSKKQKCLFVRMDPKVLYREFKLEDKESALPLDSGLRAIEHLTQAGTKHLGFPLTIGEGFQPRFVANTYFSDTFEEDLPRRTKRFLKQAEKRNVTLRKGCIDDVEDFADILSETEDRKNITLRTADYHRLLMETYGDDALLYFAEVDLNENYREYQKELKEIQDELIKIGDKSPKKEFSLKEREASVINLMKDVKPYLNETSQKQILSGMLSIKYGNTLEHLYAGFDINFKKYMPQYKLYVEVMKISFEEGVQYNNMGGIEGTLDDGLTIFKEHFNPFINEYIGEFDISTSWMYPLFMIAWKIRSSR